MDNTLTGVSPAGSVSSGQIVFKPGQMSLSVLVCDVSTPDTLVEHCVPTVSGRDTTVQYSTRDGQSADTRIAVRSGRTTSPRLWAPP